MVGTLLYPQEGVIELQPHATSGLDVLCSPLLDVQVGQAPFDSQ